MLRRRFIALGGAALAAPALIKIARADTFPSRFVRLVVPFPPGGAVDNAARIIATRLSEVWGQQMVVENKGGAGGNIAAPDRRSRTCYPAAPTRSSRISRQRFHMCRTGSCAGWR